VVSFTPQLLYRQGKSPWYPLDRRLGGPQSRSGHNGEEKNSQPPAGNPTPGHPIVQPKECKVAVSAVCYLLLLKGEWKVVTWVPVTAAWHVLGLRMEETASRYGGCEYIE
jgi:hypothetical protein